MGRDAPLVQAVGKDLGDRGVAVDHEDLLGRGGEVARPAQKVVPIGVGTEPLEVDDPGPDGDLLAEELDRLGPFQ